MKRLGKLDRLALAVLLPLWALCFALELRSVLSPVGFPPVFVEPWARGEDYPRVHGFLPQGTGPAPDLRVADRLLRMDGRDLAGVSSPQFLARFTDAARRDRRVAIEFEREAIQRNRAAGHNNVLLRARTRSRRADRGAPRR